MNHLNIITTDEFSQYAPEVDLSLYSSTTVSGMISQASRLVDDYLGYSPYAEDITDELKESLIDSNGDLIVRPAKIPVISVSSIKISKGSPSGDLTLDLTDDSGDRFNIDFSGRYIRVPWAEIALTGNVVFTSFQSIRSSQFYTKLTYRGGYEVDNLPQVFKQATILYMRDIASRSANTTGATRVSQGGISLAYEQRSGKSDLVIDAERILRPYRRI